MIADDDTRRIGEQSLKLAHDQKVELNDESIWARVLISGGFFIAETKPQANKVIALHSIYVGSHGSPIDFMEPNDKDKDIRLDGIDLDDAKVLVKDAAEFTEALYTTPLSGISSLLSRYYGGHFPECDPNDCTMFKIPRSLLNLGADPSECREAVVLEGYSVLLLMRYAASLPIFAASPLEATREAGDKVGKIQAEFFRNNHLPPDFDVDIENVSSNEQLRERIELLRNFNGYLEDALKNKTDPVLIKTNMSLVTFPFAIGQGDPFVGDDNTTYGIGDGGLASIWRHISAGVFVLNTIMDPDPN